jgi:hypothetical protein
MRDQEAFVTKTFYSSGGSCVTVEGKHLLSSRTVMYIYSSPHLSMTLDKRKHSSLLINGEYRFLFGFGAQRIILTLL